MLYYLDTMIVIYAVEGIPALQQRALTHLELLELAGNRFVVSHLTWTECLVPLFQPPTAERMQRFFRFFQAPRLRTVSLTNAMHLRAAAIRGDRFYSNPNPAANPRRYSLPDSLHLAAAIEYGCDRFLTNDDQLAGLADVVVETLP